MRKLARLLSSLVVLVLLLGLVATASADNTERPSSISIGTTATFASLTPFQPFASNRELQWAMWEFLGTFGTDGQLQGNLAKSWTTEDQVVYDITLFDNIYDSKGNHITSEDVVFCYDTLKTYGSALQYDSVVATGEYSVKMTLTNESIGAFERTMSHVPIVSKSEYEKSADGMASTPVSTAHYTVTEYVPGSLVTLTRNDNYWQQDASQIADSALADYETVKFITVSEAASQTVALETGAVDAFMSINGTQQNKFLEGGDYAALFDSLRIANGTCTFWYFSGAENSIVANDLYLRMAIAYAIDRDSLNKGTSGGTGITATVNGSQFAEDAPTIYGDDNPYLPYNPELAKECLAKSNYNGEKIRYLYVAGGKDGEIIQQYLANVGINVELMGYDLMVYLTNFRNPSSYDLAICYNEAQYNSVYWNQTYATIQEDGRVRTGWADPELAEQVALTNTIAGHTQENINKTAEMLDERLYSFAVTEQVNYTIVKKGFVSDPEMIPKSVTGMYLIWAEKN